MATKRRPPFDPNSFLALVGEGRRIGKYRKGQAVFSQGDSADAVFYIQRGKIKLSVVSERGKEAVSSHSATTTGATSTAHLSRQTLANALNSVTLQSPGNGTLRHPRPGFFFKVSSFSYIAA